MERYSKTGPLDTQILQTGCYRQVAVVERLPSVEVPLQVTPSCTTSSKAVTVLLKLSFI